MVSNSFRLLVGVKLDAQGLTAVVTRKLSVAAGRLIPCQVFLFQCCVWRVLLLGSKVVRLLHKVEIGVFLGLPTLMVMMMTAEL